MKITLYSAYFSPVVTRKLGRKITAEAAKNFTDEKLGGILRSLQVEFSTRDGKYPRAPWLHSKIYDIESEMRKGTLIKAIERKLV